MANDNDSWINLARHEAKVEPVRRSSRRLRLYIPLWILLFIVPLIICCWVLSAKTFLYERLKETYP